MSNRLVKNIFTTEDAAEAEYEDIEAIENKMADIDNDCPYKVYPLFEDSKGEKLSKSMVERGVRVMRLLIAKDSAKITPIIAAGICGNMARDWGKWTPHS